MDISLPQPRLQHDSHEVQEFGTVRQFPLGLSFETRMDSCQHLNQLLADTQILYALYKKYHWLMRGPTFYQVHLLLDQHAGEQLAIIDALAERIQALGGLVAGDPRHIAEITSVPRPPDGPEGVPAMLSRLLDAHEIILAHARELAERAAGSGDDATGDLMASRVIPAGELQAWLLSEHLLVPE